MSQTDPETPAPQPAEALLRSGLEQLRQGLQLLLDESAESAATPRKQPGVPAEPAGSTPTILTDLLGFTPDQLRAQPELADEAINTFFGGVRSFLNNVSGNDAAGLAAAEAQVARLREKLARHELDLPAGIESLPQQLHDSAQQERTGQRADIAGALEALAAALRQAGVDAGTVLRRKADDLRGEETTAAPPTS